MALNYKQTEMMIYKTAIQLEKIVKDNAVPSSRKFSEKIGALEDRLAAKKFRVAVVGEFNRGKSSFINVLLGKKILPEDVLATTATINRVTYGEHPKAYLIMNEDISKTEEVPVEDLASYVTKLTKNSAKIAAEIREAVVEYPTMLCYNDIDLIDTPGMNDMDDMNAVTVNRLEDIDLAVVAVSALMPFSETERNFVVKLLESPNICQIIFVVTHIDGVREKERERLVSFIETRICSTVLEELKKTHQQEDTIFLKYNSIFSAPKLYALSSWEGMDALETGNMELYEKSGYLRLTKALPEIILNSRSEKMIKNIAYCLKTIIEEYGNQLKEQETIYDQCEKEIDNIFKNIDLECKVAQIAQKIKEDSLSEDARQSEIIVEENDLNSESIFNDILRATLDNSITFTITDQRRKMMQEENSISKHLLLPLCNVRQMTIGAVRDAILPAMQSEFSRINMAYHKSQTEIEKVIVQAFRNELKNVSAEIEKEALDNPALGSIESDILNRFNNSLDQGEYVPDIVNADIIYFHWMQSPIEAVMNTPPKQSVLPGLAYIAGNSLIEGNKQLSQNALLSFEKVSVSSISFLRSLKSDMLSRIQAFKELEKHRASVFAQLNEMNELCSSICAD